MSSYTVSPLQAAALLQVAVQHNQPALLVGQPGIGKSDIVAQLSKALDADVILTHPGLCDPTHAKGLPWPDPATGTAQFLPYGDLHRALNATKRTIWFLDDFGQASQATQASFMQLLLAREVMQRKLPDCVTFVAATNRRADKAGVTGILSAVISRFAMILGLQPSLSDWTQWAYANSVHPLVIAFLQFRPELFNTFEANSEIENYACPRTWYKLSCMLDDVLRLPPELHAAAFCGSVGPAVAGEFAAFTRVYAQLPDPHAVLLSPDTAKIPAATDAKYALALALVSIVTEATLPALGRYAQRWADAGAAELAVRMVKEIAIAKPDLQGTTAYVQLVTGPLARHLS